MPETKPIKRFSVVVNDEHIGDFTILEDAPETAILRTAAICFAHAKGFSLDADSKGEIVGNKVLVKSGTCLLDKSEVNPFKKCDNDFKKVPSPAWTKIFTDRERYAFEIQLGSSVSMMEDLVAKLIGNYPSIPAFDAPNTGSLHEQVSKNMLGGIISLLRSSSDQYCKANSL